MKTSISLWVLPHLHDVPKRKKLAIRTRIQQVLIEYDMKDVVPSPTSTGSYDHYQSYSTIPPQNATQGSPTPASYSLTAYPSEPSLRVLIAPTSFHQSMNQFSNSNNSWTRFSQYEYIYSKLLNMYFENSCNNNIEGCYRSQEKFFFRTYLNVTASRSSGDLHFLNLLCFSIYDLILCRMYQNV
jgi:hypothetical protein